MTAQISPDWLRNLSCPLVAAPMFLVSGPELVIASVRAGIVGALPTLNARTPEILDQWLRQINDACKAIAGPIRGLPAVNIAVHPANGRYEADVEVVASHRIPIVFSIMGSPARILNAIHAYGGLVFSDAATIKHARKAVDAGADGLVLLCSGAGGNTGWLNPFGFVDEVRRFFHGPLALGGAIGSGRAIRAAQILGADLAYVGTSFIATQESMAVVEYKEMLIRSGADDVERHSGITGVPASFLKPSLDKVRHLLDGRATGLDLPRENDSFKRWKDTWSAGQGVGLVDAVSPLANVVARLGDEYRQACALTALDRR